VADEGIDITTNVWVPGKGVCDSQSQFAITESSSLLLYNTVSLQALSPPLPPPPPLLSPSFSPIYSHPHQPVWVFPSALSQSVSLTISALSFHEPVATFDKRLHLHRQFSKILLLANSDLLRKGMWCMRDVCWNQRKRNINLDHCLPFCRLVRLLEKQGKADSVSESNEFPRRSKI
jgi:hypothetical protein